ncbi:zinc finger MYND domain-containing protein [Phanerochaete sordida]|uniref:Zinc finger MYND domain-containing protein n=1 Tax=Phanerochaete sordida TaxID=48140 RepID=A0A9P3GKR8_9APHY|nr:zinc finger MYND domain-containing protein [Phanerochaete sordida]
MEDERIAPFLARIYQACHHCGKPGTDASALRRCSRCRRVCYDSVDCQKADWRAHKVFCGAYSALRGDVMALDAPPGEPSADVRTLNARAIARVVQKLRVLQFALGRELEVTERNLLGWEPRCLACARTEEDVHAGGGPNEPLTPCANCKLSFYCSDAHRVFAEPAHTAPDAAYGGRSQCDVNRTIRGDALLRGAVEGPAGPVRWAPDRVLPRWAPLSGDWESEYMSELVQAGLPPPARAPLLRAASDGLVLPLTILWALERLNEGDEWTRRREMTVHIIGASQEELLRAMQFEEILHRLPELQTLNLVLIGPEMTPFLDGGAAIPMDVCPQCARRGRRRVHFHRDGLYHDYVSALGGAYKKPDLAVAFNSGCGSEETESWKPTLRLLGERGVPSIFTAFNTDEVALDSVLLEEAGAHLLPGLSGPNPWGSLDLKLEPNKVRGFYASCAYVAGVFK